MAAPDTSCRGLSQDLPDEFWADVAKYDTKEVSDDASSRKASPKRNTPRSDDCHDDNVNEDLCVILGDADVPETNVPDQLPASPVALLNTSFLVKKKQPREQHFQTLTQWEDRRTRRVTKSPERNSRPAKKRRQKKRPQPLVANQTLTQMFPPRVEKEEYYDDNGHLVAGHDCDVLPVTTGDAPGELHDDEVDANLDLTEEELQLVFSPFSQEVPPPTTSRAIGSATESNDFEKIASDPAITEYTYERKGQTTRTFRVGQTYETGTGKIYRVEGFQLRGNIAKRAICRRLVDVMDTFLGQRSRHKKGKWYIEMKDLEYIDLNVLQKSCKVSGDYRYDVRWEPPRDGKTAKHHGWAFVPKEEDVAKHELHGKRATCLDICAGAGGMHAGLENAGFAVTHAVELDSLAAKTHEAYVLRKTGGTNDFEVFDECLKEFLKRCEEGAPGYPKTGTFNHMHASFPCVGFSTANREENGGRNGPSNNELVHWWALYLQFFQPETASFENVTGFLQKEFYEEYYERMVQDILGLGYTIRVYVLDAADFGDPQKRSRLIISASKKGIPLPPKPTPTHGPGTLKRHKSIVDAIGDLEKIDPKPGVGKIILADGSSCRNHSR